MVRKNESIKGKEKKKKSLPKKIPNKNKTAKTKKCAPKKNKNANTHINPTTKKYKKEKIPKAVREQVWVTHFGKTFSHQCYVNWCKNKIDVFNYHVGHNKPESMGGTLNINNLRPICSRCNLSMGNKYTIDEWIKLTPRKKSFISCCFSAKALS